MKNSLLLSVILFCLNATNTNTQELLAIYNTTEIREFKQNLSNVNTSEISNLLSNKTFSYKYQGKEVIVIFHKKNHIEYFNNKKYYIKSRVIWTSEKTCTMVLKESNLPGFPFKNGAQLELKITKVKRNYIHYKSTLGGRTWKGKMKKK